MIETLAKLFKFTLIEKDHLGLPESREGLLLTTEVLTTCAEAIFRVK